VTPALPVREVEMLPQLPSHRHTGEQKEPPQIRQKKALSNRLPHRLQWLNEAPKVVEVSVRGVIAIMVARRLRSRDNFVCMAELIGQCGIFRNPEEA